MRGSVAFCSSGGLCPEESGKKGLLSHSRGMSLIDAKPIDKIMKRLTFVKQAPDRGSDYPPRLALRWGFLCSDPPVRLLLVTELVRLAMKASPEVDRFSMWFLFMPTVVFVLV